MVLLRETISMGVLTISKSDRKREEISLFYDLNSIYSGIDLKLWNIKENNIFFDININI
jgi:hypothetical protein